MFLLLAQALAQGVNNPGGERIPFVKLQSDQWDVVIRVTGPGRARLERVKAQCNGIWVNGCSPGVDPELRKIALTGVFQPNVHLSGDFTYCSTAVVRDIPANMARGFVNPSTQQFCSTFLDPASVRDQRTGDATRGENSLVSRLMGAENTTSHQIRIKAPPTLDGSTVAQGEHVATGERRTEEETRANRKVKPRPEPRGEGRKAASEGTVAPPEPQVPAPAPVDTQSYIEDDSDDWFEAPAGTNVAAMEARQEARQAERPAPVPAPAPTDLLSDDDDDLFSREPAPIAPRPQPRPAPAPAPAAMPDGGDDIDFDDLFAPLPGLPPEDQVVVPAPKPQPTRRMTEMERLEAEDMALEGIGRGDDEDEKKRKGKKPREDEGPQVGTDDALGDYIIIDIEDLPDE
ncbi:MAG: hypothetical protein H6734_19475 [Alphaproteobacteria bacterium]|nr:hypothetical protein [Alphaproteobacteria bacterium]